MSELRTNRIIPRDGLPAGASGGIIQMKYIPQERRTIPQLLLTSFVDAGLVHLSHQPGAIVIFDMF